MSRSESPDDDGIEGAGIDGEREKLIQVEAEIAAVWSARQTR